jgi:ketosteroid isomerase-like protein
MLSKFRLLSLLSLLVLVAVVISACQPIHAEPVSVDRTAAEVAKELMGIDESEVVDAVGPSTASDPAQAQAEDEFREAVLAREHAFYTGDAEGFNSFYADNVVSLEPGTPDRVGKTEIAAGTTSMFETTELVGRFTLKGIWVSGDYATRRGEWEEVTAPIGGGQAEHHIGRCFVGWQKIDGEWKVVSQILNFIVEPTEIQ